MNLTLLKREQSNSLPLQQRFLGNPITIELPRLFWTSTTHYLLVFGRSIKPFGQFHDLDLVTDLFKIHPDILPLCHSHEHAPVRMRQIEPDRMRMVLQIHQSWLACRASLKP